jgi:hypothetical protein
MFIPDLDFFPIPDPGVKKAADPKCRIHNTDTYSFCRHWFCPKGYVFCIVILIYCLST